MIVRPKSSSYILESEFLKIPFSGRASEHTPGLSRWCVLLSLASSGVREPEPASARRTCLLMWVS